MLNAVLNNLINIGWAMLIFLCAYLSNVAFSLYYHKKSHSLYYSTISNAIPESLFTVEQSVAYVPMPKGGGITP